VVVDLRSETVEFDASDDFVDGDVLHAATANAPQAAVPKKAAQRPNRLALTDNTPSTNRWTSCLTVSEAEGFQSSLFPPARGVKRHFYKP
jgi:hypothetical protein